MRIDSHNHFWNYSETEFDWIDDSMKVLKKNFLPKDFVSELEKNNFDGCVAIQAPQTTTETEFLLGLAKEHFFIKGVVGWLDLSSSNLDAELEKYTSDKYFKGLRHIVQAEKDPDFLQKKRFNEGIKKLTQFDLTYDILIFSNQIQSANAFIQAHPNQKFVLDHIAKPDIKNHNLNEWKLAMTSLKRQDNLWIKISGMVTEADWKSNTYKDFVPYLDFIFENFPIEKLMFGSDWPVCLLAADYPKVTAILQTYMEDFSENEKNMVFGKNAYEFYNL